MRGQGELKDEQRSGELGGGWGQGDTGLRLGGVGTPEEEAGKGLDYGFGVR